MFSISVSYRVSAINAKNAMEEAEDRLIADLHPDHWHFDSVSEGSEFWHVSFHVTIEAEEHDH